MNVYVMSDLLRKEIWFDGKNFGTFFKTNFKCHFPIVDFFFLVHSSLTEYASMQSMNKLERLIMYACNRVHLLAYCL